jgi:hypothetical protein
MDPELANLVDRIDGDSPPDASELQDAREQLLQGLRDAVEGDEPDIDAGRDIRNAIDRIDQEVERRNQSEQQQRDEARQLLDGLNEPEGGEEPSEDPQAEVTDPSETAGGDTEAEPVAASTRGERLRGTIQRRNRRTTTVDRVTDPRPVEAMLAGPALGADEPQTLEDAADVFHRYAQRVNRGRQTLIELRSNYPEERKLGASPSANTAVIDRVLSPRALAAAGGVCEPVPADFTHPICGDRGRPIRDSLPQFGADRGGVRFQPAATLDDLQDMNASGEDAVNVWTQSTDESPGTETKPAPRIDCETETETLVDAVVAALTIGNFQARFNPEFWQSRLDLLMVLHDRVAEQHLFSLMQNASVSTSEVPNEDGTARTLMLTLDRVAAAIRSRHRLTDTALRWLAPLWVRDAIRASLARQQPGDGTEALHVADGTLESFFSDRNIIPVWSPDLDVFGDQSAGAQPNTWPGDNLTGLLYPEGTFFFLDGGIMDLGTEIQDSTLNETNDRQTFVETFEQVAQRGCESIEVNVPVGEDCVCSTAS